MRYPLPQELFKIFAERLSGLDLSALFAQLPAFMDAAMPPNADMTRAPGPARAPAPAAPACPVLFNPEVQRGCSLRAANTVFLSTAAGALGVGCTPLQVRRPRHCRELARGYCVCCHTPGVPRTLVIASSWPLMAHVLPVLLDVWMDA